MDIVRQWAKEHHYDEDAMKCYGKGQPRLVVVGERHDIQELKEQQINLCDRLGSDTVAHEMLANHVYYPEIRILRRNSAYPVHASSEQYLSQFLEERKKLRERMSPEEYRKLMEMSYDGHAQFPDWRRKNNVGVLLNPFEQHEISGIFGILATHSGYNLSRFPRRIKKIVGCDIDYAEKKYLIDFYREYGLMKLSFRSNYLTDLHPYQHRREERMAQVIADNLRGTRKPLVAILGAHHIRENRQPEQGFVYSEWPGEDSWIHKSFAEMRIPYIVVDQRKSKTCRYVDEEWNKAQRRMYEEDKERIRKAAERGKQERKIL